MKINKPFSSFKVKGSLVEKWKLAICDPAYIIMNLFIIMWLIYEMYK